MSKRNITTEKWIYADRDAHNYMHEDLSRELLPNKEQHAVNQMISSHLWLRKTRNSISVTVHTVV